MVTWMFLDKAKKEEWLSKLFDLLYENMCDIAPSGMTYEKEKENWLAEVSPALERKPRQILMCLRGDDLIGYLQYYTRDNLLVIEEMQLKKEYQRTTLFKNFGRHLLRCLPKSITVVEAYADKRNAYSQKLMRKLNMDNIAAEDMPFLHFRGAAEELFQFFQ